MAGHSKWANIKHKKGTQDAKKGAVFGKLAKEITVAVRVGQSADEDSNPRLRAVILKARAANMPKDNIERAIKKGLGPASGAEFIEIFYEGYAPCGVALLVSVLTDNKNRSVSEVRSVLTKQGGSLGTSGSVAFLFSHVGFLLFSGEKYKEEDLTELALELNVKDLIGVEENLAVFTEPGQFLSVAEAFERQGFEFLRANLEYWPIELVVLTDEKRASLESIIEKLEALDDVQAVYSNLG